MRELLGSIIGIIGVKILECGDWLHEKHLETMQSLYSFVRAITCNVFYFTAKVIDKQNIEAAEQRYELKSQQTELDLLSSASKVRDHAIENDDWSDHHSHAINAIALALMNECNWEIQHVHNYLRSVVETVDGVYYGEGTDAED